MPCTLYERFGRFHVCRLEADGRLLKDGYLGFCDSSRALGFYWRSPILSLETLIFTDQRETFTRFSLPLYLD